jgi:hypothetical protein
MLHDRVSCSCPTSVGNFRHIQRHNGSLLVMRTVYTAAGDSTLRHICAKGLYSDEHVSSDVGDSAVGGVCEKVAGSWAASEGAPCAAELAAPRFARRAGSAGARRAASRPCWQQALQVRPALHDLLLCLLFGGS